MRLVAILLLMGLFLLPATAFADGEEGTLTGKVVNKTPNGSPLQPVEVKLSMFTGETGEAKASTITEPDGSFEFKGLATTDDRLYQVSANFLGAEYHSKLIGFGPQETALQVELAVFDTTESDAAIRIDRAHAIIDIDPDSKYLRVMQIFSFANAGDRSYVARAATGNDKPATVKISLPSGAEKVEANYDMAPPEVSGQTMQLGINAPLPPGSTDVMVSYLLAYGSSRLGLRTALQYDTGKFDVFFVDVGASISSPQLPDEDVFTTQGSKFRVLSGRSIPAGSPITIDFKDLPMGAKKGGVDGRLIAFVAIGAAAVLAASYPLVLVRRRRQVALRPAHVNASHDLEAERRELVLALADLDDQFERGEIPEASYQALRAQKKRALAELLARQRAGVQR